MNLKELAAPFPASDVEWRIQSSGVKGDAVWARCLAYITSRAVMQRLDDVCGPERWKNEYRDGANGAVLCGISIKCISVHGEPEWITKWDGAENTDVEAVKGGLSGAMKRAAVQWGIGRYLYDLEEGFAKVSESGAHYAKTKDNKAFKWDPPSLPRWALPTNGAGVEARSQSQSKQAASATPAPSSSAATSAQLGKLRFLITDTKLPAAAISSVEEALATGGLTSTKADKLIARVEELSKNGVHA